MIQHRFFYPLKLHNHLKFGWGGKGRKENPRFIFFGYYTLVQLDQFLLQIFYDPMYVLNYSLCVVLGEKQSIVNNNNSH